MLIIPAILTNDPAELEAKILKLENIVQRVHIDIIDGIFTNNKTVGLDALVSIETSLGIDIHLMTKEPIDWVDRAVEAGADRIIGQIEMMFGQQAFVSHVQELGSRAGIAIDIGTDPEEINSQVLPQLDIVLVMGVKAGLQGQEFNKIALEKIKKIKKSREEFAGSFTIYVDGGVNKENINSIIKAGAEETAIGSSLFEGDIKGNLERLNGK